jgi:hypothetical protein
MSKLEKKIDLYKFMLEALYLQKRDEKICMHEMIRISQKLDVLLLKKDVKTKSHKTPTYVNHYL